MDFLDSLDLQTTDKKSNRVRSWYLYEQYKSLEKNQLDATKKLKNKSYQDRILLRELNERRARRQFSEQFDLRQSDSRLTRNIKSDTSRTPFSESTDSFFESVYEQEDIVSKKRPTDTWSLQSETSKLNDEFKSFDNKIDTNSCSESINSVVENNNANQNVADDIKEELELVKRNINEIINLQREAEKECLEKYTELCDNDNVSDNESLNSIENKFDKYSPKYENTLLTIWSKLVEFSHNVMKINRGNCYYDYSTQFLTAVLACDVLRRGISRMCDILQPYVSPIKFANNELEDPSDQPGAVIKPDKLNSTTSKEIIHHKFQQCRTLKFDEKYPSLKRKYWSEEKWHSNKYSFENKLNTAKIRRASEPCRSVAKFSRHKTFFNEPSFERPKCSCDCKCPHMKKAINPIIKLSRYIDMILREIEDD